MNAPAPDVVGAAIARPDAYDKLTGCEQYVCDMALPGMLHAAVVRSTRPHARIVALDGRAAAAMPGVAAVLTAADIPGENVIPVVLRDQPFLAREVVRYIGEPIALVAAETAAQARAAAAAVQIEYDELPAVFDACAARRHAGVRIFGPDNIFKHLELVRGETVQAFAQCAAVVENTYTTPPQEHAYLETQGMLAVPLPGGVMQVYGSMQCPFYVREAVAATLGIALARAQIVQTTTGGAFGGKEDVPSLPAAQAALLAWRTRRPVKLIYGRDEDIACTSKRHAAWIHARHGALADGTLHAVEVEYVLDGGAYATLSPVVLFRGVVHAVGPYRCAHVRVTGDAVATNNVPAGAFRGFGSPQVLFAAERQMDELARALRMDAVELRRRNLLQTGDATVTGQVLRESVGAQETLGTALETARARPLAPVRDPARWARGTGVSAIFYGVGLGAGGARMARTGADVCINEDGSVAFAVGTTEIGQGMRTVLSQIVADTLGIAAECVTMLPTDTTRVPDSGPTVASRATTMSGAALQDAAMELRRRLMAVAGELLGCAPQALTLRAGTVCQGGAATPLTFRELVHACGDRRVGLAATGWHHPPTLPFDWATCQGDAYAVYAFATNIADVEVDRHTGQVRVLRIVAAHDVGKAVNPALVEGQIEGGTLQGLGYALYEEVVSEHGRIKNAQFSTYIIPSAAEMPEIVPVIVEAPYSGGPFGAKGFGEQPLMGVAPAIANAVCNALGLAVNKVPLTPEYIWHLMDSRDGK